MKATVVGGGSWGTTMASVMAVNARTVLWAREPEVVEAIRTRRQNAAFLEGYDLDPALEVTSSLQEALGSTDVVFMAVPAQHFREVLELAAPWVDPDTPVLSLVKGLEEQTLLRMTEVVVEVTGRDSSLVGVVTGPNLAREVIEGQPTATVVALEDPAWSRRIRDLVTTPRLRAYSSVDVVGCETAGALKNVIAIAAGIAAGLGFGENTKAALVTRGLAELTRLGVALGGNPLTFLGLAGNGDLFATCSSPQSRNRHVGHEVGRGRALDDVVDEMHMVAEGVRTVPAVLQLAERHQVEMPISRSVHQVLYEGTTPLEALQSLMARDPKAELEGLP